ncbi:SUN domain-containing protein 1 [Galdieria sulphuraria]|nr:SUN domain-containing protein 1 [Galdieria sulphuraria]
MNLTSPLTRAKARELALAQSPSRSVLTEPLYTSPRRSLFDNTDDSAGLSRRKTISRSGRKSKNTKYSFSSDDKENISIHRSPKSREESSLSSQKGQGKAKESYQIDQNLGNAFQKDGTTSYSTLSSPPYFSKTSNSERVVEDSSPLTSNSLDPKNSSLHSNSNERKNRSFMQSSIDSKKRNHSKANVFKLLLILFLAFILIGTFIVFSLRTNTTLESSRRQFTSYRNMLGWFRAIFYRPKNERDSFETALSFMITQITDLAISLEQKKNHPEAILHSIQDIMEKTENILKEGIPYRELREWRETLYRQLFNFINLHEVNDISSNDIIARLLESKLRLYYKLTKQDYALSSEGAKVICSTPSKLRQQSRYWLARMASFLDPSINTTVLRYPKGPETILSDNVSVGNCWAFAGKTATVTIQLSKTIQPIAFSLEHIINLDSKNVLNAPKLFRVYLIQDNKSENGQRLDWLVELAIY